MGNILNIQMNKYLDTLKKMYDNAPEHKKLNYKAFIIEVIDEEGDAQIRPVWAKDAFQARRQIIAANPRDYIKNIYTMDP